MGGRPRTPFDPRRAPDGCRLVQKQKSGVLHPPTTKRHLNRLQVPTAQSLRNTAPVLITNPLELRVPLSLHPLAFDLLPPGPFVAMNVKNDALAKAIDEGARFGKGDVLRVKLRIIKEYVPDAGTYRDSSLKIVEFYEQIRAERQGNLF